MHYRLNAVKHNSKWYEAYVRVNELFAEMILERCQPGLCNILVVFNSNKILGDLIWIHDYHLLLLPSLLRERLPRGVPIGFFFHVPFPSSELFRILPNVVYFLLNPHSLVYPAQRNTGGRFGCRHDWISIF